MKKIVFISPECFLDVDIPIIKELSKRTELLWIVTFSISKNSENHIFTPDQVLEYSKINKILNFNILCSFRVRDPRRIFLSIKLINKIKRFSPDIIYFDSFYDPYLAVFSSLLLEKNKIIIGVHDVELHPGADSFFHKVTHYIIMKSFLYYHVFSNSQLDLFRKLYPNKNVFRISMYVKNFGIPKKGLDESKSRKINFLFFGTDYPYKGLDVLIRAVNLLSKKTREFIITVAGKSDNFSRFNGIISDRGLFNLNLNFIKSEDIPTYFNHADFIILPYYQVTQCGPLMIAFNYTIPAIASDLHGFTENIIDGSTGFIFTKGDPNELAEIMGNIIQKDRTELLKMKKDLSDYVKKNYNIDHITREYLKMFSKISP